MGCERRGGRHWAIAIIAVVWSRLWLWLWLWLWRLFPSSRGRPGVSIFVFLEREKREINPVGVLCFCVLRFAFCVLLLLLLRLACPALDVMASESAIVAVSRDESGNSAGTGRELALVSSESQKRVAKTTISPEELEVKLRAIVEDVPTRIDNVCGKWAR